MCFCSRLKSELQSLRKRSALRATDVPAVAASSDVGSGACVACVSPTAKQERENSRCCARCRSGLGRIINRGALCKSCRQRICKACRQYSGAGSDWVCTLCYKNVYAHLINCYFLHIFFGIFFRCLILENILFFSLKILLYRIGMCILLIKVNFKVNLKKTIYLRKTKGYALGRVVLNFVGPVVILKRMENVICKLLTTFRNNSIRINVMAWLIFTTNIGQRNCVAGRCHTIIKQLHICSCNQ